MSCDHQLKTSLHKGKNISDDNNKSSMEIPNISVMMWIFLEVEYEQN